jgi:hypothetical protein
MLDVHPPHEAAHTWKDFFIHIATIVVGLLIAIALEQSVEWMHHRHIIHVARENIHTEMDANRKLAANNLASIRRTEQNMNGNIKLAQALMDDPHALDNHHMSFNFQWSGFKDSAWHTARDTGALALMPVDEVQGYADVYEQQDLVNTQAVLLFQDESQAAAPLYMTPDKKKVADQDVHALLLGSTNIYLRLRTLEDLTNGLQN